MKTVVSDHQLCLSGKSWEIRARLREWSSSSLTVYEFIQRQNNRNKQRPLLLVLPSSKSKEEGFSTYNGESISLR